MNGALGTNRQMARIETDFIPIPSPAVFTVTIPHTIGRPPDLVTVQIRNKIADNGYVPGEIVPLEGMFNGEGPAVAMAPGLVTFYMTNGNLDFKLKTNPGAGGTPVVGRWEVRCIAVWSGGL